MIAHRLDSLAPGRPALVPAGPHTSVILLRLPSGGHVAYRNACPHMGVELDRKAEQLLSHGGGYLRCTVHGALFRFEDGYCISGPCLGDSLRPLPAAVEDGLLVVQTPERAATQPEG